ncbi:MAG: hypothetical protein K2N91_02950, partial [Muribaculaceae bacterium]|nr:hypothetical protein [Muribaculaceae bacterium]
MKKIFTLLAVAAMAYTASAQSAEWNVSNWAKATYKAETTLDGFTIYAAETEVDGATKTYSVVIDGSSKTVNGTKYTNRLKTGGAGGVTAEGVLYRILSFDVPSNGIISLIATSSNGSEARVCGVSFGEYLPFATVEGEANPEGLNTIDIAAGNPVVYEVKYAGNTATKAFIYSKTGGINFYDFKFTPTEINAVDEIVVDENAPVEYFNLQGVRVADPSNGLFIRKQGNK